MTTARIVASAAGREGFPRAGAPEVAMLGRSNAGKSSLLNKLAGRRELARVSATPGKTRLIHFFEVVRGRRRLLLVDLPGYGWARVSQTERAAWRRLVESYLEGRAALRAAVLLQDVRRDAGDDELDLVAWLAERGVPTLVALTKCDKLKPMQRAARVRVVTAAYALPPGHVVATSARSKQGIDALWKSIDAIAWPAVS